MSTTPDAILGLRYLGRPEGQYTAYFFLEADRGSMPVVRRNRKASSIARKLLIYYTTYRNRIHTKQYGFKHFRVLTVTESSATKRIASMIEAAGRLEGLQGMFLFAIADVVLGGDALSMEWVNGKGQAVALGG